MVSSENQVRQLYVVHSTNAADIGGAAVQMLDGKTSYIQYNGYGGIVKTEFFGDGNVVSAVVTNANKMTTPLKRVKVILGTSGIVAGQDYILRINIDDYIGISPAYKYNKYGIVHAYSGMDAKTFYKTMAESLVKNFSREVSQFFKFYLETGGTSGTAVGTLIEVTKATKFSNLTGTYTGIVIEEAQQDWVLGKIQQESVNFTINTDSINVSGDEVAWGIVNTVTSANSIGNGRITADLEYFLHGERGDIYRGMGYPNNFTYQGVAFPNREYHYIDIVIQYSGSNEDIQKSQKVITLAVLKGNGASDSYFLVNGIINDLNDTAKLGLSILS